ncbi:hypothetical protein [Weissella koreensis]
MNSRNNNDKLKILKTSTIKYRLYKFGKDLVNGSNKTTGTKDIEQIVASDHTGSKVVLGALLSLGAVSTTLAATNSARADNDVKNKVKSSDKDSSTLANKDHSIIALTNSEGKENKGIDVTPTKTFLGTETFTTIDGKVIQSPHTVTIDPDNGNADLIYPPEYEGYYPDINLSNMAITADNISIPISLLITEMESVSGQTISNWSEFISASGKGAFTGFFGANPADNSISFDILYSKGQFEWDKVKDLTYDSTDPKATKPTAEDYIDVSSIKEPDGKTPDLNKLTIDDSKVNYEKAGVYDVDVQFIDRQLIDHHQTAHLTVTAGEFEWAKPTDQTYDTSKPDAKKPTVEDYIDVSSIKEPDGKAYDKSKLVLDDSKVDYTKNGTYTVTITYTDDQGVEHSATANINVIIGEFKWDDNVINQTYDSSDPKATKPTVEDYIDVSSIKEPDGKPYDKSKLVLDDSKVDYTKAGTYQVTITYTDDQGAKHSVTAKIKVLTKFTWDNPKDQTYDSSDPKATKPTAEDYIDVNSIKEPDGEAYNNSKLVLDDSKVDYTKAGTYTVTITYTDDQNVKHTSTATITVLEAFKWGDINGTNVYDSSDPKAIKPTIDDYIDVNSIKEPDGKPYDKSRLVLDDSKVNYDKAGAYQVTITYIDDQGVKHEKIGIVTIVRNYANSVSKSNSTSESTSLYDSKSASTSKEISESNSEIISNSNVDDSKSASTSKEISESKSELNSVAKSASDGAVSNSIANSDSSSRKISDSNNSKSNDASDSAGTSKSNSNQNSNSSESASASKSDSQSTSTSHLKSDSDHSKSASVSDSKSVSISTSSNNSTSDISKSSSISVSDSSSSSISKSKSTSDDSNSSSASTSDSSSTSSINPDDPNLSKNASTSATESDSISKLLSNSNNDDSKASSNSKIISDSNSKLNSKSDSNASNSASSSKLT